jgi:hypothetical protein
MPRSKRTFSTIQSAVAYRKVARKLKMEEGEEIKEGLKVVLDCTPSHPARPVSSEYVSHEPNSGGKEQAQIRLNFDDF